jgi:DUF1680 family protein
MFPPLVNPIPLEQVRLLDGPFKHAMDLNGDYLLRLEPDRLLSGFRENAGLEKKAERYGGWESQGVSGHTLGHYLTACSMMYAASGDARYNERVTYIVDELGACQDAREDGFIGGIPDINRVLKEIAAGDVRAKGFDLNGLWVPWYTQHKLYAGLLDAHRFSGNEKALAIVERLADFDIALTDNLNEAQFQHMLACEHGGMNESLAELYGRTGKEKYLTLSRRFHHKAVLDPLGQGVDNLPGLHANTQIPKVIGVARRYELTGNQEDRRIAEFFWDRVVNHHSYVIGGNSDGEHFGAPDKLNDRLGTHSTETCNTYNMLKLTRHLFTWTRSMKTVDYYERALYNHILASQNPDDGMMCYPVPLKPGHFKSYNTPFNSFWCCTGTGIENHVKYGDSIYFEDKNGIHVNLFIASELDWVSKGIKIRQETRFPEEDTIRLTIACKEPTSFNLVLRRPGWLAGEPEISFNDGDTFEGTVTNHPEATTLLRVWEDGDTVTVRMPMELHTEAMPDNPNRIAVMYGPIVLAGDLGAIAGETPEVPVFVTDGAALTDWLKPVPGKSLTFRTEGVGKPGDVTLSPFYAMHHRRYSVYWDVFSEAQWEEREAEIRAEEARLQALELRTVDLILPGEQQSEVDHAFADEGSSSGAHGGRRWRHVPNGWFSYEIAVSPDAAMELMCTYWGSDANGRVFDILIDGEVVATQTLENGAPGQFFDVVYTIPEILTRGKEKVVLKFVAHEDKLAGGIYGCRMLRAK